MNVPQLAVLGAIQRFQIAERSESVAFDLLQLIQHGYLQFDQTGESGKRCSVKHFDGVGVEIQFPQLDGAL